MASIVKSKTEIEKSLVILADQINTEYKNVEKLDIICFINGASFFCSDLVRLLNIPIKLHHFGFTSYEEAPGSGEVKIDFDLYNSIEQKHVLILEGMIISGKTPQYLINVLKLRNPASLKLCAIGVKKEQIKVDLNIDFHMFDFKDEWVEGYGIGSNSNKCLPYLVDIK